MIEAVTLADVLAPDPEKLPSRLAAAIDQTATLSGRKALIVTKLSGVSWLSVAGAMARRVPELLQTPFSAILARAWKDVEEVRRAIVTTRESPGRTELVALADRTVTSEHKPSLEFYEGGTQFTEIEFVVLVDIDIRGLLLEIEKGTICRIRTGDVQLKGTLKLGDFTLAEKALEPIRIPGEIRFAEPDPAAAS